MKDLLKSVVRSVTDQKDQKADLHAVEYMDDGSSIALRVEIDGKEVRRNDSFFPRHDSTLDAGQSQI